MKKTTKLIIIAAIILSATASWGAGLLDSATYNCTDLFLSLPAGAFLGGFDVLPNGNYVINDGHSVREITQSGADVQTLYTYSASVFGSFVKYNNGLVYFADNDYTSSMVRTFDPVTAVVNDVTRLDWNYDIDFYGNNAFVVAGNTVYALDASNNTTPVATAAGYSGPVALDAAGNLYYCPSNYPFATNIYMWSSAKVQGAIEGDVLGIADADAAIAVNGAAGLAFDSLGRLLFSDNSGGQAKLQRWDGVSIETLATLSREDVESPAITFLRIDAETGGIYAGVNYYTDGYANNYNYIVKLEQVPEPSSIAGLCSLIALAGSAVLRRRG
ncbi:MAG: PEP-CTERM sorting domain-containing protein [Armatimonadota bacterium]|jgi:hypothetical protein